MAYPTVSKSALLEWINTSFELHYTKIEQCGNGAVYCMIFNALYPNLINISRVQKNANTDYDILINYKLLQNGFNKVQISRDVNVEKLMKCRLQDNLEFLQWFSRLWCDHNKDFTFGGTSQPNSRRTSSIGLNRSNSRQSSMSSSKLSSSTIKPRIASQPTSQSTQLRSVSSNNNSINNNKSINTPINKNSQHFNSELAKLKDELKETKESLEEMTTLKEGLEIERNFYFGKLREIEVICQNISQSGDSRYVSTLSLIDDLKEIMYSTEEGFLLPDDNDEDGDGDGDEILQLEENGFNQENDNENESEKENTTELQINNNKINLSFDKNSQFKPEDSSNINMDKSSGELFDDETF
ncbi:hypothetical protein C6P40_003647 [Pichia californica]|uniref:EB1 C-terminal domain-containing protein n=1 Tax=Pichia californica TaxID=460514 RepID=A0A9P6WNC8_9ASCO|nr:hypothetical protein C6P42_004166 [[Candida] californica]KAG0690179.1 hypothetical protein C6P40_003647 [[Candida] californica]